MIKPMMKAGFKSLTAKVVFLGAMVLGSFVAYISATYLFTHHMRGEARRMNLAGTQRMLTIDMGRHMLEIADMPPSTLKNELIERAKKAIEEFERVLYALRDGSEEYGIRPVHSRAGGAISQQLNGIIMTWQEVQKPYISAMLERPDKEAIKKYNLWIHDYVDPINGFVISLEKHYDKEIEAFDRLRFYVIIAFGILFIAIALYMRKSIIEPVVILKNDITAIKKGDFDARAEVRTSDEIGTLAEGFNEMALTLGMVFEQKSALLRDLNTLYGLSRDIVSETDMARLLRKTAETASKLVGSGYAAIGIFKEMEEGYEHFVTSGLDEHLFEKMKQRYGLPKGKGLLGFLMREGKPLRIDDISMHPASIGFPEGHPPMKGFLGVPIAFREKVIGRIYFTEKTGGFTRHDEDMAVSFANICAIAISNAQAKEQGA